MHISRGKAIFIGIAGTILGLWLFIAAIFDQHIAVTFRRGRRINPNPDPDIELFGREAIIAGIVGLGFAALCATILILSIRRKD